MHKACTLSRSQGRQMTGGSFVLCRVSAICGLTEARIIFIVAAGGGMGGLVLAACVGIQAAFEGDEIVEKLQRDEVRESGEPFA